MRQLSEMKQRQLKVIAVIGLVALLFAFAGAGVAAAHDESLGFLLGAIGVVVGLISMVAFGLVLLFSGRDRKSLK